MEGFGNWYQENKGLFIGMCIGLGIAVLFLTIGFWATLLIAVCVGAGAFFGKHVELREAITTWFTNLFEKK